MCHGKWVLDTSPMSCRIFLIKRKITKQETREPIPLAVLSMKVTDINTVVRILANLVIILNLDTLKTIFVNI